MKFLTRAVFALAPMLLIACGEKAPPTPALPAPAAIVSFAADKTRISAGQSVTLSFTARDAISATLVDQSGQELSLSGDASGGSVTVKPAASTFYLLRVKGGGGSDSAFVQVGVDEDLKQVFLVAIPSKIESGQSAQLLWSAFHAKEAHLQSSAGDLIQLDAREGSGVLEVNPARTLAYTLSGKGGEAPITATVELKVAPVLKAFETVPAAARIGEKLTLHWQTAGAGEVTISEATWGPLHGVTHPAKTAEVDDGNFEWIVPAMLPNGDPVIEGQPLRFTLTVTQANPATTLTRSIESFVGEGPHIAEFNVPAAATVGRKVQISWRTLNADRIQILANGALVFEPVAFDRVTVAKGSISLDAPASQTTYEIVAFGHEGTRASAKKQTRAVGAPAIDAFNLPSSVNQPGDAAAATWTTHDASEVTLRVERGPVLFASANPATVSTGTTSIHPGARTTFVLEAWNEAGDKVTARKTVDMLSAQTTITATPSPLTLGDTVNAVWSVGGSDVVSVIGDPAIGDPTRAEVRTSGSQNFVDLAADATAKTLSVADPDESLVALPFVVPFRFPFLGPTMERFYVSTNGFVSFGPGEALGANAQLALDTEPAPAMVAPFWDDLTLGQTGRILYKIEGSAFPRRLIVQWDKVQTDPGSELTFQAQLLESGEFHFVYKTLTGTDAAGDHATVGWRATTTSTHGTSYESATLHAGDEIAYFSDGPDSGHVTLAPEKSGTFTVFTRRADGIHVVYPAPVNVIAPGSVRFNELMVAPQPALPLGQWIELTNVTTDVVNLSGTRLDSVLTGTTFTFPEGTEIAPGGYLVVGDSQDPNANGEAHVDVAWTQFDVEPTGDDLALSASISPLATWSFNSDQVTVGSSLLEAGALIRYDGTPLSCSAHNLTYGTTGSFGTPGAANEPCFPYGLQKIPVAFEDISVTGTRQEDLDNQNPMVLVDLAEAPFTHFGRTRDSVWVDLNGDLTFGVPIVFGQGNALTPQGAEQDQFGMVAPYWDELLLKANGSVYVTHRSATWGLPARWIVQWSHVGHSQSTDDLTFQVKLFDDGTIEYHYGQMTDGDFPWPFGASATAWLCAPDYSAALPLGILQPVIESNTAYRFAPTP